MEAGVGQWPLHLPVNASLHPSLLKSANFTSRVPTPADVIARIKTCEWLAPGLFINLLNHTVSFLLTLAGYWDCLAAASPAQCPLLALLPLQLGCQLKGIQSINVLFLDSPMLLRPLLWGMTSLTSFTLFAVPDPENAVAIAWLSPLMEERSHWDVFLSIWTRAGAGIHRMVQMNTDKSIF